jgi:uncharacterized protein
LARWAFLVVAVVLFGLALPVRARAAAFEPPPTPTEWVTDNAGFLSAGARSSLDQRLDAYAANTGHQVLVWIGGTTGDVPLEDFAVKSFESWKVGRKGIDDGVVLFLFAADRKVRIEVGYGLEDKVPDAVASRIIRETIVPRIQAGDHDGAVTAGVEAITARIDGKLGPGEGYERPAPQVSLVHVIFLALGLIALIVFLAMHPSLAAFLLTSFFWGGRGGGGFGGGGGGGGGFSGGGGRSGGGGASGSW